jgi:hypothetical protein
MFTGGAHRRDRRRRRQLADTSPLPDISVLGRRDAAQAPDWRLTRPTSDAAPLATRPSGATGYVFEGKRHAKGRSAHVFI